METVHTDKQKELEKMPHLVFKVKDNHYAIDSNSISSIMQYDGSKKLPNSPKEMVGIVIFREKAVPIIDIRSIFSQQTLDEEYQEFVDMLSLRSSEHTYWVEQLEKSVETGEDFNLAVSPHECAFGKWYDNYNIDNNSVMFHLRKIKEPHDKLHFAAEEILACDGENDDGRRGNDCKEAIINQVKKEYMPTVLGLIDETKEIFKDSFKEMVIMVGQERPIGLKVDEVIAVEYLEVGDSLDSLICGRSDLLIRTMKSIRDSNIIYLLDDKKLLERYQHNE